MVMPIMVRELDQFTSQMSIARDLKQASMTAPMTPIHLVTTQWTWVCTVTGPPRSVRMLDILVVVLVQVVA